MQFRKDMIDAILEGRKTRTTRPVKKDSWGNKTPCTYKVGRTYAVQPGRCKKAVGYILVTSIRLIREGIAGIPEDEREDHARREGFSSWFQFTSTWDELYQYAAAKHYGPVWVIDFELVKGVDNANREGR